MNLINSPSARSSALHAVGTRIANVCLLIAAASLLVIVAINGANVVARYIFAAPFSWAEEAMLYLMIVGVFTASVAIAWQQRHIRIDALLTLSKPTVRRVLEALSVLISICVLFVIGTVSYRVASMLFQFDQRSDAMGLPMWIPHSAVAIAIFLIAAMMFLRLFGARGLDDDENKLEH